MLKALIDCVRNVFPFITHCTHTCIKKQRSFQELEINHGEIQWASGLWLLFMPFGSLKINELLYRN